MGLSIILHFWSVQRNNYYCTSSDSCYSRPNVVNLQEPKWLFVSESVLPFTAPACHLCIKLLNSHCKLWKYHFQKWLLVVSSFVTCVRSHAITFFCTDIYLYLQLMVALWEKKIHKRAGKFYNVVPDQWTCQKSNCSGQSLPDLLLQNSWLKIYINIYIYIYILLTPNLHQYMFKTHTHTHS